MEVIFICKAFYAMKRSLTGRFKGQERIYKGIENFKQFPNVVHLTVDSESDIRWLMLLAVECKTVICHLLSELLDEELAIPDNVIVQVFSDGVTQNKSRFSPFVTRADGLDGPIVNAEMLPNVERLSATYGREGHPDKFTKLKRLRVSVFRKLLLPPSLKWLKMSTTAMAAMTPYWETLEACKCNLEYLEVRCNDSFLSDISKLPKSLTGLSLKLTWRSRLIFNVDLIVDLSFLAHLKKLNLCFRGENIYAKMVFPTGLVSLKIMHGTHLTKQSLETIVYALTTCRSLRELVIECETTVKICLRAVNEFMKSANVLQVSDDLEVFIRRLNQGTPVRFDKGTCSFVRKRPIKLNDPI
jgi:hypothetical protein